MESSSGIDRAAIAPGALALVAALAVAAPWPAAAAAPDADWVVSARAARDLVERGALVLDARPGRGWFRREIPGAVRVAWQDWSEPAMPGKGRLLADLAVLARRVQAAGVTASRAVVVVGDPSGAWGEDGRIAWALRTLGHPQAVLVDGGAAALEREGRLTASPPVMPGDFRPALDLRWSITAEELRARLGAPDLVVLDAREPREYAGETPYGEARGGHLPGARALWFRQLVGPDGRLLPRPELERLLAARGVRRDAEVVSYCSGGVRSAWVTAVLVQLGFRARNYAGSTWEWASAPAATHPLLRE